MNKWKVILIAVVTVLFYSSPYLINNIPQFVNMWFLDNTESPHSPIGSLLFSTWIFTWPFASVTMLIFYIGHVLKSNRVPQCKKTLWGWVLFFGNIYVIPVYWYLYIWKEPEPSESISDM